jgi:pimeloyl-[acyl-carrier protein] methyl ester esterase
MTTPRPFFVFVHGWGFDAGIWDAVRAALPADDTAAVDLGFFGNPVDPPVPVGRLVVVVGHSFGVLLELLDPSRSRIGLVSVNGFPRFTEADDFTPAVPRRMLDRMIARFETAPETVLTDFRRRCGVETPPPPGLDHHRLDEGLRGLRDGDARGLGDRADQPILALAGAQDPIVPAGMSAHAFTSFGNVTLEWHPDGGHLLPLTAPDWVAARIAAFGARPGLAA